MNAKKLICTNCRREYSLLDLYYCKHCDGILSVKFEYSTEMKDKIKNQNELSNPKDFLPIVPETYIYNGQGNTPLVFANRLNKDFGVKNIAFKCEFLNPTGSFKDRPVSVGVSKAIEFGYKKVVVASSGNGAAAVSSFCAAAGIDAIILVSENTPDEKIRQAAFYGGQVIKVSGPYSNCFALAKELSEKFEILNLTTTFINPYTVEGNKLIAYELFYEMKKTVPDAIFVPIGAGPLLGGIYKGYIELQQMGLIEKIPKMVGVQAAGCCPVADAFEKKTDRVFAIENPSSIAGGICDGLVGYTNDGEYTLECIVNSGGWALSCTDEEILATQKILAQKEGIFVEPSSAAAVSAISKLVEEKKLEPESTIVVLLTGSGLKDMSTTMNHKEIKTVKSLKEIVQIFDIKR